MATNKTIANNDTFLNTHFGIEIETTGINREQAARAMATVLGGDVYCEGGFYNKWIAIDSKGRKWTAMTDGSVAETYSPNGYSYGHAECVSPKLTYAGDMELLQNVVRALYRAGARPHSSAGIHVHVDAAAFDVPAITRLVKTVRKQETLIAHMGDFENRVAARQWCHPINEDFYRRLTARKTTTLDQLNRAWYGYNNNAPVHYDGSRYHGLNLHNVFFRGTVEFRYFNSTLHAGKVRSYVSLCLALATKAINTRSASGRRREWNRETAAYDGRVLLINLGLIGDEFKAVRDHLLGHLRGNSRSNGRGTPRAARTAA